MKFTDVKGKPWEQTDDREWAAVGMLPVIANCPGEPPQPITLTIADVKKVEDAKVGGKSVNKKVLFFNRNPYINVPMMLNSTNQKTLSRISGSRLPENWIGKTVILHCEKTRNPSGGESVLGLRIVPPEVPIPPAESGKMALKISCPNFESIKEWVKSGKGTVEKVKEKYYVEPSALKELV